MHRIIEIATGSALLYSGLVHASAPYYFASVIAAYDLLPVASLVVVPFILPYLMLVVGCCLVFDICKTVARKLAASLLIIFFFAQLLLWLSGAEISCGCFGYSTKPISPMTMSIPAVLGVVLLALIANDAKCHGFANAPRTSADVGNGREQATEARYT